MHLMSSPGRRWHFPAHRARVIVAVVILNVLTVFLQCAVASSAAPAKIQGCWNLMTNEPLRITLKLGEASSVAYVKVRDSHALESEYVYFDQQWSFWHEHVADDGTRERWDYSCDAGTDGNRDAAELRCDTNFELGKQLYFQRCSQ